MSEMTLLPCPFCGYSSIFEYDDWHQDTQEGDDGIGWALCTNQKCGAGIHDDHDSAVEKWNKRAESDALRAEVERLTQELQATNDQWAASATSALETQRQQAETIASLRGEIESLKGAQT